MKVCLPPSITSKFVGALKDGKINPEELTKMTSEERHKVFSDIVGEDYAKLTNANFESKLLLKNQQRGFQTWAKQTAGITPEVRRDLITKIQKMDHILNPEEEQGFLKDLAATKLGVDVTDKEAKQISEHSQALTVAKDKWDTKFKKDPKMNWRSDPDRLAYGRAKVQLSNYVNDLKETANKQTIGQKLAHPIGLASDAVAIGKSLKSSLDNSALGRPGLKILFTHPTIWGRNAKQSFIDMARQFKGNEVLDEVKADVFSRPNVDQYAKMKIGIGNAEESFPSQLPEKIPGLGRAFKASEAAYTGFMYRTRADLADLMLNVANKNGVNTNDRLQLESMGKLVNSLTNRGYIKNQGAADALNKVFFSPRAMKANFDTLTAHQFQKGVTPFVRKQAAEETLKIIAGTAAILAAAHAIRPDSVETDMRSSDYGKIKIGNTRFDVTGGMAGILTLAARLGLRSSKTGGSVKPLGNQLGQKSGLDLAEDFLENKASPGASVILDLLKGQDRNGNKLTPLGEGKNLYEPLPLTNFEDLRKDPNSANDFLGVLADGLGIGANNYGQSSVNWNQKTSKELDQFKAKVGQTEFDKANSEYNQAYDDWFSGKKEVANLPMLKDVPADQRADLVTRAKGDIQNMIFHQSGFKYELSKQEKADQAAKAKATKALKKQRGY